MLTNTQLISAEFRVALLRHYISQAFISLMAEKHGREVFIAEGEIIPLSLNNVAVNIIYHIEFPYVQSHGAAEGGRLAAQALNNMLAPNYMSEAMQLSPYGIERLYGVYLDIIYGAPDSQLPPNTLITHIEPGGGL